MGLVAILHIYKVNINMSFYCFHGLYFIHVTYLIKYLLNEAFKFE